MAATMLAAWALKPPTLPAMAEPTKFLLMFSSTRAAVLLFNTCRYDRLFVWAESAFYLTVKAVNKMKVLYLLHHLSRDGGFTHSRLASAQNPVNSSGLLVSAVVATQWEYLHVWTLLLESVQGLFSPLQTVSLAISGISTKCMVHPYSRPEENWWRLLH